jgi:hypothetical protein
VLSQLVGLVGRPSDLIFATPIGGPGDHRVSDQE